MLSPVLWGVEQTNSVPSLDSFQDSDAFLSLASRTREDYKKLLRSIANVFGDFPLAAMTDRKARGVFLEWRDGLAKHSRRQADYAWAVLAQVPVSNPQNRRSPRGENSLVEEFGTECLSSWR